MDASSDASAKSDATVEANAGNARARRHPLAELRALRHTYGDSLLKFIFSVMFGLKGGLMSLVGTAALPYSQKYLRFSAVEMQRYGIVAMFPWTVKPIMGMVSDLVPIGGYHKRYYVAMTSVIGCAAVAMLAS